MNREAPNAETLLEALRDGSVKAFHDLYETNIAMMYGIAFKLLNDPMEAEDVCHDVILESIRGIDKYDPNRGSLQAWLAVKTRSRCLDRLRRSSRLVFDDNGHAEAPYRLGSFESAEEQALTRIERERLLAAMARIPSSQRLALQKVYLEQQTQQEFSQSAAAPLGTVKSWIRYGLRNMRKQLSGDSLLGTAAGGVGDHES